MNQYSENLLTLSLYPTKIYDEDLTIDCGIEIDDTCSEIHEACKGWGKDSKRLIKALGHTTSEERKKISIRYQDIYSKDLRKLMKDECSGDFGLAMQFLAVGPVEAECYMIKHAVHGWGADKLLLYSILCGRSNEDMILLKKTYYKLFTDDLVARVSSEVGGDLKKKILMSAVQAAEEEFNPDYHTKDKATEDAEVIYKAGQGRWGTDENRMAKIIVLSPPKYLKLINEVYADMYGYTLFKAFEKELGKLGGEAALFTLGMKLKPYETVSHLIKKATKGLGTNETLLTCNIIRYQDIMGHVYIAHEQLFEKSIHKRVVDETSGSYKDILTELLDVAFPQY